MQSIQNIQILCGLILLLMTGPFIACSSQEDMQIYHADRHMDSNGQLQFVSGIIRYMGKTAPKADHQTKFDTQFDEYYEILARAHRLDFYHFDEQTGYTWFLVSRIAPSLHVRRVGIGGRLKTDDDGRITWYEEIFRTWKLPEDELGEKSRILFAKMVNEDDLTPFYAEHSGDEEYIEFPDSSVHFDVESRMWVIRNSESGEMYTNPASLISQD